MAGLVSSPRWRRRAAKWGALGLISGAIVFSMVHWSNTAEVIETPPIRDDGPGFVAEPPPKPVPFSRAVKEGALETAGRFLSTAVLRENVDASWDLAAPSLKEGYTRRAWATQDIPVQPYPMDSARWDVDYSWEDTVGLKIALFPKKGSDVPAAMFDMQLHAFGKGEKRHWLVDSWTPSGYTGVPQGPLLGRDRSAPAIVFKSRLGPEWLLVPLSVFFLLALVPVTLALRGWRQSRAAMRHYRAGPSL